MFPSLWATNKKKLFVLNHFGLICGFRRTTKVLSRGILFTMRSRRKLIPKLFFQLARAVEQLSPLRTGFVIKLLKKNIPRNFGIFTYFIFPMAITILRKTTIAVLIYLNWIYFQKLIF